MKEADQPAVAAGTLARGHASKNHGDLAARWGERIFSQGFTAVPNVLLDGMGALDLTPTDLTVLTHLLKFWWTADEMPFPSKRRLAQDIGCGEKTIQKTIARLEKRGAVKRIMRKRASDRNESNIYNLWPLLDLLEAHLAQERERRLREEAGRKAAQPVARAAAHA
ncbi:MAG TPA: helix-turn-helix domain-containing protein [Burkholderiales bacterium]